MKFIKNKEFYSLTEEQQHGVMKLLSELEEKLKNQENLSDISKSITYNADGSTTYESVWKI